MMLQQAGGGGDGAAAEEVGPYTVTSVRLGEGGQVSGPGEGVFRGHVTETGMPVAVKRFNFARLAGAGEGAGRASKYTRLKREVENSWRVSGHPSIVTLGDVLFDASREYLLLVMELGDGKDLFDHVSNRGAMSEQEAAGMFKQVAEGVRWVHGLGVCHRDLKLENILLHSDNATVKIADFGMSKDFSQSIVQVCLSLPFLVCSLPFAAFPCVFTACAALPVRPASTSGRWRTSPLSSLTTLPAARRPTARSPWTSGRWGSCFT